MANENVILVKKTVDKSYEMSTEEAQRYLLNLPLGEVKVESEEYGSDNVNSMRLIKVSDNEFVFVCP